MSWSIFIFISGDFYACSGMKTIMNVLVVIIATGLLTTNTNAVITVGRRIKSFVKSMFELAECCDKIKCHIDKCVPQGRKNGVVQCYCLE